MLTAAGKRNAMVKIQKNTPTTNADGQQVASWKTVFPRWVSLIPRGGGERVVWEQVRAEITHISRLPYDSRAATIKPASYRLLFDGSRALNIISVIDRENRHEELELHCEEVVV